MSLIDALEWCDRNMHSNYPLLDSATGISESGVHLPSSFLVDAQIVVPGLVGISSPESRFFVSSIDRIGNSFVVTLSFYVGGELESVECATTGAISADINNTSDIDSRVIPLVPASNIPSQYAALQSLSGHLIIGSCIDMSDIGALTFSYAATKIIGLRVHVFSQGLQSVSVIDSEDTQYTFRDDFILRAGDGIELEVGEEYDDELGVNVSVVTVKRTATAAELASKYQNVDDIVADVYEKLGNPIRRINGIVPDSYGNFVIDGEDCVDVVGSVSGIIINNPCSRPCCGEGTTADVQLSLDMLEQIQVRLTKYYESMANNVNAIQSRLSSLIASRK